MKGFKVGADTTGQLQLVPDLLIYSEDQKNQPVFVVK